MYRIAAHYDSRHYVHTSYCVQQAIMLVITQRFPGYVWTTSPIVLKLFVQSVEPRERLRTRCDCQDLNTVTCHCKPHSFANTLAKNALHPDPSPRFRYIVVNTFTLCFCYYIFTLFTKWLAFLPVTYWKFTIVHTCT